MVNITYNRKENITKIELGNLNSIKNSLPLKIQFKNIITDEIHYEIELADYRWVEWCGAELITDVLIFSSNGDLLYKHEWDVVDDGDEIEKMLWFYLKSRKTQGLPTKGLVIGSHDGRNGHWVLPVKEGLTDATLIDGSEKQFIELVKNYKNYPNTELLNNIVTTDGSNVEWYQGGEGYTDTIIPSIINNWLESSEIVKIHRKSVSINDLMKDKNYDWLHLDVEGLDGELIRALEYKPNIIIYENMHLDKIINAKLNLWFVENSYEITECNGNTIAVKN